MGGDSEETNDYPLYSKSVDFEVEPLVVDNQTMGEHKQQEEHMIPQSLSHLGQEMTTCWHEITVDK